MAPIPVRVQESAQTMPIEIHEPGSKHASLADGPGGFDREWFMGKWGVAWSTLPMWKGKKNVMISYVPLSDTGKDFKRFESSVSSLKESQSDTASPSTIRGVETLTPESVYLSRLSNGATFDWRGRNLLYFIHSHWEVLGYGEHQGLEWAVTFFSSTLFTPAGMDIYIRAKQPSSSGPEDKKALVGRIADVLKAHTVTQELAKGGFECPGVL